MKKITRLILLSVPFLFLTTNVWCQDEEDEGGRERVRVVEPEPIGTESRAALIDTEKFELGFYLGSLSVEDFGNDVVSGVELSYRLNQRWFLQANYGMASIDRAAFESSQLSFLAEDDRDFEYLALVGGYRLIQGRSFFGARKKYGSEVFFLVGPEQVKFADNSEVGLVFGMSYRIVMTDWLTTNIDFREHFVEREFIGDSKKTLNTEFRVGFNFLF